MLIVYGLGILIFTLLFLYTMPYQKALRTKLDKKQHKLLVLYGMSMFLVDKIPKRFVNGTRGLNKFIKELYVKENIKKEKYLYIVYKMAVCIMVIFVTLALGMGICVSESLSKTQYIKSLKRDNSKTLTYEFMAKNDKGQEETVVVEVPNRELTVEETYKLFENMQKSLVKQVLNKNKSVDYVNQPLNFVTHLGAEGIKITWDISNNKVLDYNGDIAEDIPGQGTVVEITATMELNQVSVDYTFSVNVFPKNKKASLQEQVQQYVNEHSIHENHIKLPTELNGRKIKYYSKVSKISGWILLIGIIVAVMLFFLRDRDIKKSVKVRNAQILYDYPEITSKILLYYEAGLSIKSSLEKIVCEYKKEKKVNHKIFRYAYEELEMAVIKMNSGVSESVAINEYGSRCGLHCYIKLANIIEQNLKRGTKELSYALKNEAENAILERKNNALREGEQISTKLLGPMVMMLIISIVVIIVPALISMNM